jgi:hypothetical protein
LLWIFKQQQGTPGITAATEPVKRTKGETLSDVAQSTVLERYSEPSLSEATPTIAPLATDFTKATLAPTKPIATDLPSAGQGWIEFYGKVVDEHGNPIPGASISFRFVETSNGTAIKIAKTESDTVGLFSLHGQRGTSLGVSVTKEGFYSSQGDSSTFAYSSIGGSPFKPEADNPVIFRLRSRGQGVELITSARGPSENGVAVNGTPEDDMRQSLAVQVPKDDTPIRVDLFKKEADAGGQLEISHTKQPLPEDTSWSFRVSLPDGGMLENTDEFQFEAPETGYQQDAEISFKKEENNWTTRVTKQFYVTFGQPPRYGWVRIDANLGQETVLLTYAINPDGSRNLEPAEINQRATVPSQDAPAGVPGVLKR